jgi:hypothetical protein
MNFSSQEFYDVVVVPNVAAQHADTGSYRHAVNAIASLDDYIGIWALELLRNGKTTLKEESFRDYLAGRSEPYRILRDMAYSLKHGELTRSKGRLVKDAERLHIQGPAFSPAAFSSAFAIDPVICVKVEDGRVLWSGGFYRRS